MNNQEKALHFAELGVVDYATLYATLALIDEIKELKEAKENGVL